MSAECAPGYDVFRPKHGFGSQHRRNQKETDLGLLRTTAAKGDRLKRKSSSPAGKVGSASPKEQKRHAKISSPIERDHRDSAESLPSNRQLAKNPEAVDLKFSPKRRQNTPPSPSTENVRNQTSSPSRKGHQHQWLSGKHLVTYTIALSDLLLVCCAVWLTYMALNEGERCQ